MTTASERQASESFDFYTNEYPERLQKRRLIMQDLPVGGSLGTTAVNVLARAQTRWAVIFSGLALTLIVIALSGIAAHTIMLCRGVKMKKVSHITLLCYMADLHCTHLNLMLLISNGHFMTHGLPLAVNIYTLAG
ncbi:hypothetical protein [Pontibacter flavimaris]|uniref:Uncharacterized protein n=1 Tax=Pontibacter flavimaris TaxID=1797110 RepID=A0A1Q5P8K1_9BACT|nr:hypothetical protein [Pontibacter flavimaris]OKL38538.1 hypothetical protein A3841_05115 [Pontibacter flavimaris]